jgi:hypothetical protein
VTACEDSNASVGRGCFIHGLTKLYASHAFRVNSRVIAMAKPGTIRRLH